MRILLLGGTGRTGRLIAERLVRSGHAVTMAGRRDPGIPGALFTQADLTDGARLGQMAAGTDAVISALASGKGNPVCSTVARVLAGREGLRVLTIGGAGVDAPGDRKGAMDRLIGWIMRRVVAEMLADRQAELAILQASRLRWTMLRPPRLTDGPATGQFRTSLERPLSTKISRQDLAAAVEALLTRPDVEGRAPFVSG